MTRDDAFRAQRDHVDRSLAIDRTGWTRQQWVDDARAQMSNLDGSVMDLLNGHVTAMLAALADVDDELCKAGIEYPLGARGVHDLGSLFEGMAEARDEARAALAERDAAIERATNVLENWAGAIDPDDYDRRFIQAMRRALHSSHWPNALADSDALDGPS